MCLSDGNRFLHNAGGWKLRVAFAVGLFFLCGLPLVNAGSASANIDVAPSFTEAERQQLREAVIKWNSDYDSEQHMIRRPFSSPGYHTTLKGGQVHSTRESLSYAVALLNTGEPEWAKRAEDVLRKVISLQDQDPASKTYGIWSWFLEEPLAKMSPPDWNWADFCGVQLLQVALLHRERLPRDLLEKVDAAIRHAARSIQRRNVGPGYTNIAIMGTYVTLIAAELYDLADLQEYALGRLRRFHAYTMEQGAFTEYNSPTYTVVALQEIGRLRLHAKDPEARRLADDIYRLAWEEIAQHFHPPTRQWAGPHSRCYRTLLPDKTLAFLQHGLGGRVRFFPEDPPLQPEEFRLPLRCPQQFEHYFERLDAPRELVKTFVKGKSPVVGTTYLDPQFALGSVNRGDLWNQRRSLVAYWGTGKQPSSLQLRFLHDGYDFADAQFFSAQSRGTVLAGVVLGTDGGDTHVSLDRITHASISASDFRLRFEFGGCAGSQKLKASSSDRNNDGALPNRLGMPVFVNFGELRLRLECPFAVVGLQEGRWESGFDPEKHTAWLDIVLYEGSRRDFQLGTLEQAAVAFCLQLSRAGEPQTQLSVERRLTDLILSNTSPQLRLVVPTKPAKIADLHRKFGS